MLQPFPYILLNASWAGGGLQYDLADCAASFYNVNAVVERYCRFGAIGGIVNGFTVGREYGNVARYARLYVDSVVVHGDCGASRH